MRTELAATLRCAATPPGVGLTDVREMAAGRGTVGKTFCSVRDGNCVEVGQLTEPEIVVRNCTNVAGPVLRFTWDHLAHVPQCASLPGYELHGAARTVRTAW